MVALSVEYRRFGFWRDRITHPVQGALLWLLFGVLRLLPIDAASGLGGRVGRILGPCLGMGRRAERNLRSALPDLDAAARGAIIRRMWDNLGRVMGEYPHLRGIVAGGRIEFVDRAGIPELRRAGRPLVFFGAHLGNWELLSPLAVSLGIEMSVIYRSPNNRFADRLVRRLRDVPGLNQIRKCSAGAREAFRVVRGGGALALLVDQKFNAGLAVPFFGRPAMTAPAAAQFAIAQDAILLPARVERLDGARFRVTLYPPMEPSGDVGKTMLAINAVIEGWIRERPEQWLWIHRRWPES